MPASPTAARTPVVVEVLVSSSGFSDTEHVEFADDKAARAFAREIIRFAISRGRRRGSAAPPAEPQGRE